MGCSESKIKQISLTSEHDWEVGVKEVGVKGLEEEEVVVDEVGDTWRAATSSLRKEVQVVEELRVATLQPGGH